MTLLVGITLINIGAAAIAAHLAGELFGARFGFAVEMLAMIIVLTTFGEVLPMTMAVKHPEPFLAVARPPGGLAGRAADPGARGARRLTALTVPPGRRREQAVSPS